MVSLEVDNLRCVSVKVCELWSLCPHARHYPGVGPVHACCIDVRRGCVASRHAAH
jgi:hypothetical protein